MPEPQLRKLTKERWQCLNCGLPLIGALSMIQEQVRMEKGGIFICSNCTAVHVLDHTALKPLSREQFAALDPESRRKILATIHELKQQAKSGNSPWSPYDQGQTPSQN
jgi:Zn-finger protein